MEKDFPPGEAEQSAAGGLALFQADGATGKACSVKIARLADTLTDQNGGKTVSVRCCTLDEVLNLGI